MRGQKLSKIHFLILLSLLGFIFPLQSQEYIRDMVVNTCTPGALLFMRAT